MLFLNTILLLGLLAVGVPIVLHLLNRKSARVLDWGAIQFLLDSLVVRRRRILLEEVLLLVARCLLIALVAMAVARPFVPAASTVPWGILLPCILAAIGALGASAALWQFPRRRWTLVGIAAAALLLGGGAVVRERFRGGSFAAGARQHVVIVLDGSDSMQLTVDGRRQFDRAVDEAMRLIEQSPRGTMFSVLLGLDAPLHVTKAPTADRDALAAALSALQPAGGTFRVLESLADASRCISEGPYPVGQIVVFGDAQREGWELDQPGRWELLRGVFASLPSQPRVLYRTLKGSPSLRNASVASVQVGRGVVAAGRECDIEVRVENTGTEPVLPGAVTLHVGKTALTDKSLGTLDPGAAAAVRFRYRPETPCAQVVRAEIAGADDLPADNARETVKQVVGGVPVLIVDGGAEAQFADRAGSFLALALSPSRETRIPVAGERREDAQDDSMPAGYVLQPRVIDSAELMDFVDFNGYGVVVLADLPIIPPSVGARLEQFVRRGGGLLVTPGMRADPASYGAWLDAGQLPFLPAALGRPCLPTNDVALSPETFGHPAVSQLSERAADLGGARLRRFWRMEPGDARRGVSVCARLTDGSPFLVERQLGRGCVLQAACAMDVRDSDLVTRRGFVPLINELGQYLARTAEMRLTFPAGKGALLQFTGGGGTVGGGEGLYAEYFSPGFKNRLAARCDANLNLNWGANSPGPGLPPDGFVARWSGVLTAPQTGHYEFDVEVDDRAKVILDGRQIIGQQYGRSQAARVWLRAGHRYSLAVEFEEEWGDAYLRLSWKPPHGDRTIVPSSVLSPLLSAATAVDAGKTEAIGPDGSPRPVRMELRDSGVLADVDGCLFPGVYSLKAPEGISFLTNGLSSATNATVPFAVLRSPEESKLALQSADDLQFVRGYVKLEQPESAEQLQRALQGQATGRELWRYLAVAALLLLVAEVALTRWIARGRHLGSQEAVDFQTYMAPPATFQDQVTKVKRGGT